MFWRLISFITLQLAGGLAGWYAASSTHAGISALAGVVIGIVLGGFGWFLIDLSRGVRLLRWLRVGRCVRCGHGRRLVGRSV